MEKVAIAKIIKPQGIKGECKIKFLTDDLSVFEGLKQVYLGDKLYNVKNISIRFGFGYVTFEGVKDRNQAELLRNKKLFIPKENIELKQDEYFVDDLIGFDIVNKDLVKIGVLLDIEQFGAADVFVIEQYQREYRVPFLNEIFVVDFDNKRIIADECKYDEVKICD